MRELPQGWHNSGEEYNGCRLTSAESHQKGNL